MSGRKSRLEKSEVFGMCNNGCGGNWCWIIILLILLCGCGNSMGCGNSCGTVYNGNNNCGCC